MKLCDLKALCEDYWKNIRETYTRPSWCLLDDIDTMYFCGVPMKEAVEVMRMYKNGELVHLTDRKTEPQNDFTLTYTCSFNDCENFKHFGFGEKCIECKRKQSEAMYKDEPQTDLLVTEYPQDGEVHLIGRDKTEAVVMAYDVYKELTEPQTERSE